MNHEPTELQKCLVPDCGFETNTKGEFKAHQRTHSDYKYVLSGYLDHVCVLTLRTNVF